jgi:hypothetical protein
VLFDRVVIYTAVAEPRFRAIAALLVGEGNAPAWFAEIEYVEWDYTTKDLALIPNVVPGEALLVDDLPEYVHRGQEGQWVPVEPFIAPYPEADTGFIRVAAALEARQH